MTWDKCQQPPARSGDGGHSDTPAPNFFETVRVKENYIPGLKSESRASAPNNSADALGAGDLLFGCGSLLLLMLFGAPFHVIVADVFYVGRDPPIVAL
jgi:hypothetical protein